jgi:hypothetical protein
LTSIPEGFNPTVGGYLDLSSLTSIPEGFNPTVGGYLDLRSLTSIPEGFNPTVGGYLDLRSLTSIPEGFNPTETKKPTTDLIFWGNKYIKADGIFSEIISKKGNIYKLKNLHKNDYLYLVTDNKFTHAHAGTIKKAQEDFSFKILSEKIKNEPINLDSIITVQQYRIITGACEIGVKQWIETNLENNVSEIKASDLLPLLEKTNAYGLNKFKSLIDKSIL